MTMLPSTWTSKGFRLALQQPEIRRMADPAFGSMPDVPIAPQREPERSREGTGLSRMENRRRNQTDLRPLFRCNQQTRRKETKK